MFRRSKLSFISYGVFNSKLFLYRDFDNLNQCILGIFHLHSFHGSIYSKRLGNSSNCDIVQPQMLGRCRYFASVVHYEQFQIEVSGAICRFASPINLFPQRDLYQRGFQYRQEQPNVLHTRPRNLFLNTASSVDRKLN